ncbi:hypothetical protein ES703_93826 [subsurface metagenome]
MFACALTLAIHEPQVTSRMSPVHRLSCRRGTLPDNPGNGPEALERLTTERLSFNSCSKSAHFYEFLLTSAESSRKLNIEMMPGYMLLTPVPSYFWPLPGKFAPFGADISRCQWAGKCSVVLALGDSIRLWSVCLGAFTKKKWKKCLAHSNKCFKLSYKTSV